MQIQSVTSNNIPQSQNKTDENINETSFKDVVLNSNEEPLQLQDKDLTFQKINQMSLGEIEGFYQDKNQNALLNTLKYSTLFSGSSSMNEALFNMVLSQDDLQNSQSYLYTMMSNRNSYLSNDNNNDHGAWLRKSMIDQIEDKEVRDEQIKLEKEFQYTMIQFDVSAHMSDMMNFSKDGREKNRDNSGLSSMYNNMYMQYQSLFNEYDSIENNNSDLLSQKLTNNRFSALSF